MTAWGSSSQRDYEEIILFQKQALTTQLFSSTMVVLWGVGAAGSAFDWQSRGHEFDPRTLHHIALEYSIPTLFLFCVPRDGLILNYVLIFIHKLITHFMEVRNERKGNQV